MCKSWADRLTELICRPSSHSSLVTRQTIQALCTAALMAGGQIGAADLQPTTAAAFDRYVRLTEHRIDEELLGNVPFLWVDRLPEGERHEATAALRRGEIVVNRSETRDAGQHIEIPGGLCHHWVGTIFVPGARLDRAEVFMQAYDEYQRIYWPAVRRSRTVSREGDRFHVSLQLFMKRIVSVVLNTEYDVRYMHISPRRVHVRSISTKVAEVREPDTPDAHEEPVGHDSGFLWRFNNYCALEERDEGMYSANRCRSVGAFRPALAG